MWTPRRYLRSLLAGFGGAVIGFLTGAASGEAAAIALNARWAHPEWIGAVVGGVGRQKCTGHAALPYA